MDSEPRLANIPNALAASGLSNIGFAVLCYSLGNWHGFLPNVVWIVCLYASLGVVMLGVFLTRAAWYPGETSRDLVSHPRNITTLGAISISLALLGRLLTLFDSMSLPAVDTQISVVVVVLATALSLIAICIFIPLCFQTRTYPEPYFCVVIYSIFFVVVSFPGDTQAARIVTDTTFLIGLLLSPAILVMIPRAVCGGGGVGEDVVANDPSVCIMQAGPGILCTAWLSNPPQLLSASSSSGVGAVVSHVLFALSTTSFLCVLVCLVQRRKVLSEIGVHPQWAPLSFPFINSALAAGTYSQAFPSPLSSVWACLLASIAVVNHTSVNYMFLSRYFFIRHNYGISIYLEKRVIEDEEAQVGDIGAAAVERSVCHDHMLCNRDREVVYQLGDTGGTVPDEPEGLEMR